MKAEIISIGDELLIGQIVNTNASWIAQQLNKAGIEVSRIIAIADSEEEIFRILDNTLETSEIIIFTGGLGPTNDDITKDVLCKYFNTKLVIYQKALNHNRELFRLRGFPFTEKNRKQAEIPECCTPVFNKHGTAPGMIFKEKNRVLYFLPGVPYEMTSMLSETIIPDLLIQNSKNFILHKTILTQGIGESFLSDIIKDWESNLDKDIKIAYLPSPGLVRIRLTAVGSDKESLLAKITSEVSELKQLISDYIYGYDTETLEEIIGELLKKNNATLSTAESCTGGYIAHRITSIAGSSAYYVGSVIAYSNQIKEDILEVKNDSLIKFGAVSRAVVEQMAIGVLNKFKTDYSVAVSGIAGPDGGTDEKPVGTIWIAIATKHKVVSEKFLFGEHRERNIIKTGNSALNMLRKIILKEQL